MIYLVLSVLLILIYAYAITFKMDVPQVLVKRSIIFLLVVLIIMNYGIVVDIIMDVVRDITGVGRLM